MYGHQTRLGTKVKEHSYYVMASPSTDSSRASRQNDKGWWLTTAGKERGIKTNKSHIAGAKNEQL